MNQLFGDPLRFAELQFRLAHELCGKCRDYHALWPYRRLSGLIAGVEADADILQPRLRASTRKNGRVLICGAADAGLLGLVARGADGLSPHIDVADRCPTPLQICRAYGQEHGLAVGTYVLDLASEMPGEPYDTILSHLFVQFVPPDLRVAFFRRLADAVTRDGTIIVVDARRAQVGSQTNLRLVRALKERGVTLPEDEAAFRTRLNSLALSRGPRHERLTPDELRAALTDAGLRIRDWHEHRRRTSAAQEVVRENVTYVAVASRG